jgi:hypothetical protein
MESREAYDAYLGAWNVTDLAERRELVERAWSDFAVYIDDDVPDGLIGREALLGYIADVHANTPGLVVSDATVPKLLDGRMLVRWVAGPEGDEQRFSGADVVEFGPDGRIVRVSNFFDDGPDRS